MSKEIISVAVISYNSESTIIETLNSILNQDYNSQYIELIIGDDASKDNTKNKIQAWLIKYKSRFYSVKTNICNINKGVVGNLNTICKLASSNWIKLIAADDILEYNCISEFNLFVSNTNASCVFCKIEKFNNYSSLGIAPKNNHYFNLPANKQFENLLIDNFISAPASFIKVSLLRELNYFEEGLLMEDYPFWLKLTHMDIHLHLLDKVLVKYRIGDSLSNSSSKLINIELNNDVYLCKLKYHSKLSVNIFTKMLIFFDIKMFRLVDLIKIYIFKNKKNKLSSTLPPLFRLISPLYLIRKTKYK